MALVLYGLHPVAEALCRRPQEVHQLWIGEGLQRKREILRILETAKQARIPLSYSSKAQINRKSPSPHHQGVIALVEDFSFLSLEELLQVSNRSLQSTVLAVLDGVQDPQNLGALIRTGVASGVDGFVMPRFRSCGLTATVAKSSAGAIEKVKFTRVKNISSCLGFLRSKGFWICGLEMESSVDLFQTSFSFPLAVVIGGEAVGLRPLVKKNCDYLVSIPMIDMESLNASVAGGICFYEIFKKRQKQ